MTDLHAEPLSPIDAATLWPQLPRLDTEVVATRGGENLLVSAGLAAVGLNRLPLRTPLRRTTVVGLRRGAGYRGVLAARELAGGAAWEVASLRIRRDKDDDAISALLEGASQEAARRRGHTLYLRYPQGSPHAAALRHGGMFAYRMERLLAVPPPAGRDQPAFRPATRHDRHDIFRLYCHTVPEGIRRHEAPTQQDWRALLDSLECRREFVVEGPAGLTAWVGVGEREAHTMIDDGGLTEPALDLVESVLPQRGSLVVAQYQGDLEKSALCRGYLQLGVRLLCARRLAIPITLKEVVAVPADSMPLPQ